MRKSMWTMLALLLALALMAGCTAAAPGAAPDAGAGVEPAAEAGAAAEPITVRISTVSEPTTLDPNLAEDFYSITPVEQLYLGLTNLNNETEEVEPELAESWTVSDDGVVWTFNLRKDPLWGNGTPVTSSDE